MRKKLLIVKKFGGTSLATIDKIKKAANIVKKEVSLGNKVIVIVSAIGKTTDKIQSLINKISLNILNSIFLLMGLITHFRIGRSICYLSL